MTRKHIGFHATTLAFGGSAAVGSFLLFIGITWWWQIEEQFDAKLFGYGLGASIFDTLGKMFLLNAQAVGPVGIIGAYCELSQFGLLTVEAIREKRVPTGLEFGSFFLAIIGALWFVIPAELYWLLDRVFCSRCCRPRMETES